MITEKERAWDSAMLDVADRLSQESKCQSKKVCAIAAIDNRIAATGLNGSVRGTLNCCDVFPEGVTPENREDHRQWSGVNEIHAEISLIADAARRGIALEGCTVYVNLQPCERCTIQLTGVGIKRIVYRHPYDRGDLQFSLQIFKQTGVKFYKEGDDSL